eukprot:FR742434.1.p1 GENE.FR742434.1~~FR742434.1.p1  ORF type:complete len:140 (-),score=8.79 FR742434.1:277-696(-)
MATGEGYLFRGLRFVDGDCCDGLEAWLELFRVIFCPTYNDVAFKLRENGINIPPLSGSTHFSLFEGHLHVWRASLFDEGPIEIFQGLIPPEPPNPQQEFRFYKKCEDLMFDALGVDAWGVPICGRHARYPVFERSDDGF